MYLINNIYTFYFIKIGLTCRLFCFFSTTYKLVHQSFNNNDFILLNYHKLIIYKYINNIIIIK